MILMCLVFSIHCNRDKSENIKEIVLNPKDESVDVEFTKEKSILFTGVNYGRLFIYNEGSNGNFYIYVSGYDSETEKKERVKKYDSDLNFISQKEFPFGQGPGDVGTGTTFCQVGDYIYGPDNVFRRVSVFDKNFNFIKFVKMIGTVLSTTFTKDGDYFWGFESMWHQKGHTVYLVRCIFPGLNRNRIHRIGTYWMWNKQKKHIVGKNPHLSFFIKKERIYFLNSADYRIIMFDMKGNKLQQVRMSVDKQRVPKEKKKEWLIEQTNPRLAKKCDLTDIIQPASWAIPLEKGFAVIKRKDYITGCRGLAEADYFDYQLNLLGKTRVPCFYQIFDLNSSYRMPESYSYQNGYLYLIYEDEEKEEYYLEKWKVEEKL